MSFTINLETEDGKIINSIDDNDLLKKYIPEINNKEFYCLKYLDVYGDTVFNKLQMDDLNIELKRIQEKNKSDEIGLLIEKLFELIEKCKNEVHLYLKFYGD